MGKLLTPTPVAHCTNPAHRYLAHAPVPCPDCHGWLDRDGTIMDRATTIARYPFMAPMIASEPPQLLPDYAGPSTGDQFMYANRLIGALARAGLAIIFAGIALTILIVIIVAILGGS